MAGGKPETSNATSRIAETLVGLITIADDEGCLIASPARLQGAIFPNDTDVTLRRVLAWRQAVLKKNANVELYTVDDIEYIRLLRWDRYQKPSHATPSRLPKLGGRLHE